MEYETRFGYAGNPLDCNSSLDNTLLTPSIFNASDCDFSNILSLSPVGDSQMNMLDMQANPQLARAKMPGNYVSGSEYFPTFPASTMAPAALCMATLSDLPVNGIPQSVPLQGQIEPQSDTLATQQDTDVQHCEAETTQVAGQKRAKTATCPPSAGEEPKPKRRRGARKKVRTEEELAIRKERHLQRNRNAAQKCRQKKKVSEDETKGKMVIERQKNLVVWNQVASVQDELESFRIFALAIGCHCHSDDHKIAAKTSLETILKTAANLQDQIDMCNQGRAQISQGLVMQRSFGGYAQQDAMLDGPDSTNDNQSPATSPQNSTGLSEQMLGPRSSHRSSHATRRLNTEFANSNKIIRKGSNDSSTQPDSAVDFNRPLAGKDSPVEDEAIGIPVYGN
ncbi:hypothetical protein IFR04_000266 [Cadophora malorum]|uniref:BZIP domain-containing protein n=1 Tax=Cadophora malorum TaxID=108018 RepID=A0A8H7WKZ7_9HELO|nr:hypothetical protein IFR04_000266 [Cadophora malorum]